MRILVLGGTQFIGTHFVNEAIRRGHELFLFHRGTKGVGKFPGATDIVGDRNIDLGRIAESTDRVGTWDAVVDTSAYFPRQVKLALDAIAGRTKRYQFISTISVYEPDSTLKHEGSPLKPILDPDATEITGETYGYLKVLCEELVQAEYGARAIIVRPGLVAGPFDPTNRFTHWAERFARPVGPDGAVLVPDVLSSALQLIDARDLGNLMMNLLESEADGIYNAAGPQATFGEMIDACRGLNLESKPVLASVEKLESLSVALWSDLPLAASLEDSQSMIADSTRAQLAGLRYRELSETAQDTADWSGQLAEPTTTRHGISPEREITALKAILS